VADQSLQRALFLAGLLPLLVFIPGLKGKIKNKKLFRKYRQLDVPSK